MKAIPTPHRVLTPDAPVPASPAADGAPLCSRCTAVCCRLTVVLMPHDQVPDEFVHHDPKGPDTMARADDGWCVALDRSTWRCGIYEQRPQVCRDFTMGGPYCRSERANWARGVRRMPV